MFKLLKHNTLLVCYSILLCVICFTPIVDQRLSNPVTAVVFGGFVIFFIKKILGCGDILLNKVRNFWCVFLIICVAYIFVGISEGTASSVLPYFLFIIPLFIYVLITSDCDDTQLHSLFHFFCFIIAFNIADSVRICLVNPEYISYQGLSEELEMYGIAGLNLGGASFLNMSVFFLNVMLISFFNTKEKAERIIFGIYAGITFFFDVFLSMKGSVILITFFSLVLNYCDHKSEQFIKASSWVVLLFLVVYFLRDFLVYSLVNIIGSDRVAVRLLAFTSDNEGLGEVNTFTSRANLWLVSIQTWLRNIGTFFFGIGNRYYVAGQSAALTGIGQHSDFLDSLAKYGLIGTSILIIVFVNMYKYMVVIAKEYKNFIITFFIVILYFAFFKKIFFPEVGFIFFCLLPLCLIIYRHDR